MNNEFENDIVEEDFDKDYYENLNDYNDYYDDEDNSISSTILDPYFKPQPRSTDNSHNRYFDENGNICVKNISAYWIPEPVIVDVIKGDIYYITGSYEGTESFLKKLERITAKKFTEEIEENK